MAPVQPKKGKKIVLNRGGNQKIMKWQRSKENTGLLFFTEKGNSVRGRRVSALKNKLRLQNTN